MIVTFATSLRSGGETITISDFEGNSEQLLNHIQERIRDYRWAHEPEIGVYNRSRDSIKESIILMIH